METPQEEKLEYSPFLPRPLPRSGEKGHSWLDADPFWEKYPRIFALFGSSVGIETVARMPATLLVFPDQGELKACWSDKTTSQCLFQTLDVHKAFWQQLEAHLANGGSDWRPRKQWSKK